MSRRDVLKASAALAGGALVPGGLAVAARAARAAGEPPLEPGPQVERLPAPVTGDRPASPRFPSLVEGDAWDRRGTWDASWVGCAGAAQSPLVSAYRLRFAWPADANVRLRVSADERYELFLDGERVSRGPERGDLEHWFYDTRELRLTAGPHVLVARVFSLGPHAPLAQFQVRPAFLLAAEGADASKRLDTGLAPWEAKLLPGYSIEPPVYVWGLSAPVTVDGAAFAWGFERGEDGGWSPVEVQEKAASSLKAYGIAPSRRLQAGTLPPMLDRPWTRGRARHVAAVASLNTLPVAVSASEHLAGEAEAWSALLQGRASLTVPAQTRRRVILDLEDYVCAYPELATTGGRGSTVRLHFAEALRVKPDKWSFEKGDRNEIEGKFFLGMGDSFRPDGAQTRRFESLWFGSGRYVELVLETAGAPLTIESLALRETRYPLEPESSFAASDAELVALQPLLVRGMQACSHETYYDCPHFEQMQYVADARIESLCQYVMTRDDRLSRKALSLVDASRHASGLTESRYPVREPQFIPWFSLVWVGAVHDYARWRDDPALVRSLLPGVRAVLEAFLSRRREDGLVVTPEGWNDTEGTSEQGVSSLTHWMLAWTLRLAAELEDGFGEPEPAARWRRLAPELARLADAAFWQGDRALYADDAARTRFSELVQSAALLSGGVPLRRRERLATALLRGDTVVPSTVHTMHYVFEVCRALGRPDVLLDRLSLWHEMRRNGLATPIESREPTRSDCHAWGSHPLFHFYATLLGIRPADWGFRSVEVAPQLGPLQQASGRMVHPAGGEIVVELEQKEGLHGRIVLPPGLGGTLRLAGDSRPLGEGETRF